MNEEEPPIGPTMPAAKAEGNTEDKPAEEEENEDQKEEEEEVSISDNSFLVEEAYNQEPGVVQHIFNWVWGWDDEDGDRTRSFDFLFTQEWPVFSQRHQFSYAIPLSRGTFDPLSPFWAVGGRLGAGRHPAQLPLSAPDRE
jgi:hypothetical protein